MGGFGSGRWYKYGAKSTTESQKRIDIRWLRKHGHLWPGHIGLLSWSRGGETTGWISYRMEADRMILEYRRRPPGGEWEQVEQTVFFDRTRCHFGGSRTWFLCSQCGRRVAVLYWSGKYFSCRICGGLAYACQQERKLDRITRRERKIRESLGGSPDLFQSLPGKPKNMRWATYWKLCERANETNAKWVYGMKSFLDALDRRRGIKR